MPRMHSAITAPVPRPVPRTTGSCGGHRSRCATAARCPALHGRPSGHMACPCSSASSGTEVPAACPDSSTMVKMLAGEARSGLATQPRDGCHTAVASRQAYPEVRAALAAGRNYDLDPRRPGRRRAGPGGIPVRDPPRRAHPGGVEQQAGQDQQHAQSHPAHPIPPDQPADRSPSPHQGDRRWLESRADPASWQGHLHGTETLIRAAASRRMTGLRRQLACPGRTDKPGRRQEVRVDRTSR